MRQLGEQWIENGRMLKAMPNQMDKYSKHMGGSICHGCSFVDSMDDDCTLPDPPCKRCINKPIIHDLGPVNDEGLLACPFCGSNLNIISFHDGFYARCCNNDCALGVTDSFVEKQDLIDACNRRS